MCVRNAAACLLQPYERLRYIDMGFPVSLLMIAQLCLYGFGKRVQWHNAAHYCPLLTVRSSLQSDLDTKKPPGAYHVHVYQGVFRKYKAYLELIFLVKLRLSGSQRHLHTDRAHT